MDSDSDNYIVCAHPECQIAPLDSLKDVTWHTGSGGIADSYFACQTVEDKILAKKLEWCSWCYKLHNSRRIYSDCKLLKDLNKLKKTDSAQNGNDSDSLE